MAARDDSSEVIEVDSMTPRDRLVYFYFSVFASRSFAIFSVSTSAVLVMLSFFRAAVVHTWWFHALEGLVTLVFVGEVGLRFAVSKAAFCSNVFNLVEGAMCIFCIVVFGLISVTTNASAEEHDALIFLRYAAQLLRLAGLLKHEQRRRAEEQPGGAGGRMTNRSASVVVVGEDDDDDAVVGVVHNAGSKRQIPQFV